MCRPSSKVCWNTVCDLLLVKTNVERHSMKHFRWRYNCYPCLIHKGLIKALSNFSINFRGNASAFVRCWLGETRLFVLFASFNPSTTTHLPQKLQHPRLSIVDLTPFLPHNLHCRKNDMRLSRCEGVTKQRKNHWNESTMEYGMKYLAYCHVLRHGHSKRCNHPSDSNIHTDSARHKPTSFTIDYRHNELMADCTIYFAQTK
jgi:hypothetical protein